MVQTFFRKASWMLGLGALWLSAVAVAQVLNFNIPKGDLKSALDAYGKQAGVQVIYRIDDVRGIKTDGARGAFDAATALKAILVNTGLVVSRDSTGAIAIIKPPQPGHGNGNAARSTSRRPDNEKTPELQTVNVIATEEGLAALRVPTILREIPQSVSVISQVTLQQQNATDLEDALSWATGFTEVQVDSMSTQYYVRGLPVTSVHIDGGPGLGVPMGGTTNYQDMAEYDSIEVLRGADALFGTNSNPSATINLVRKLPESTPTVSADLSVGSWNHYRAQLDAGGPLAFDGKLKVRTVLAAEDTRDFYETAYSKVYTLYTVAEYDPTDDTKITAGGSYHRINFVADSSGLPRYSDGGDLGLPRSEAFVFPWAENRSNKAEYFAKLEHRFSDVWKLNVNATGTHQTQKGTTVDLTSSVNRDSGQFPGLPFAAVGDSGQKNIGVDATLTGGFKWHDRRQEITVGMDYSDFTNSYAFDPLAVSGPPMSAFGFDASLYPPPVVPTGADAEVIGERTGITEYGVYAAVRIRPIDGLSIIGGVRDTTLKSDSDTLFSLGGTVLLDTSQGVKDSGKNSPYAAITYDLTKHYSLYASYASIYASNLGNEGVDGRLLPPMDGVNVEGGLKGAWYGGRLNGSIALYKITQNNAATYDFNIPSVTSNCCYLISTNKSKGVEADLEGELLPNWSLSAGYTLDINHDAAGNLLSTQTPRHLLKLWTNYIFPGQWKRLSIGGGITAQSANYVAGISCSAYDEFGDCLGTEAPYNITQGFYSVVSLRAGYGFNSHWEAALNINNLFNRTYYQTVGDTTSGNWYGAPLNLMLTIHGVL